MACFTSLRAGHEVLEIRNIRMSLPLVENSKTGANCRGPGQLSSSAGIKACGSELVAILPG